MLFYNWLIYRYWTFVCCAFVVLQILCNLTTVVVTYKPGFYANLNDNIITNFTQSYGNLKLQPVFSITCSLYLLMLCSSSIWKLRYSVGKTMLCILAHHRNFQTCLRYLQMVQIWVHSKCYLENLAIFCCCKIAWSNKIKLKPPRCFFFFFLLYI